MLLACFIAAIAVIKSSLMGLGGLALMLSLLAWVLVKSGVTGLAPALKQRFGRLFALGALLHTAVYMALVAKLFFIEGFEDIPTFLLSHLLLHHIVCAIIAGVLTLFTVGVYLHYREHKKAQPL